jgi:murein DD-endopeptidase MepM/ murein hydrolase activator NlpD
MLITAVLTACVPASTPQPAAATPTAGRAAAATGTPLPARPRYNPGQLVDYTAQSGDTLPALAARFNTTVQQIQAVNPSIPRDATTMPAGMPMQIPIYYLPFWGTPYQILPDNLFVDGPSTVGFNTQAFVSSQPGWLKDYEAYADNGYHSGAELVDIVALDYSVSPRVLLALLQYQTGALSQPVAPQGPYILGDQDYDYPDLYGQLEWAATILNNGYYGWRTGLLTQFVHPDGTLERPDPWQTAATVAFQYYFSLHDSDADYNLAVGPNGIAQTYLTLFGDPWLDVQATIPVSLQQPTLILPFLPGTSWSLTGGPHNSYGTPALYPWAALDFAPPVSGCAASSLPAVAMADGVVVRSELGMVVEDLDGDGDERTGWDLLYLHVANNDRAAVGTVLHAGDPIGYPSCLGGEATGTHIHVARKYNGEWIPDDSAIPFDLDGWIAHNGSQAYQGTLTRGDQTITACACSDAPSHILAGP